MSADRLPKYYNEQMLQRETETSICVGEVGLGTGVQGAARVTVGGPTFKTKSNEKIPFTDKVQDRFVDNERASSDLKDYAGGAAVGGVSGGGVGAGAGGAAGAGIGALIGGIVGSIVPGPGTALGLAVGAAIGGGIGAAAGGVGGAGAGTGIGAGVVHHAKTKNRKSRTKNSKK